MAALTTTEKRAKKKAKKQAKEQERIERLGKSNPAVAQKLKEAKELRRQAERSASEAAQAARGAAKDAKGAQGLIASRDAQLIALATALEARDYPAHRVMIDFGAGLSGAVLGTAQNRLFSWAVAPKAGQVPGKFTGWLVRNKELVTGLVHIAEGGTGYGLSLYYQDGPPSPSEEFLRETSKTVAQLGTYQVLNYGLNELMMWWDRRSLAKAQQERLPAAPPAMPPAPAPR